MRSLINLESQKTDFQIFLRAEMISEGKCPEVTTFQGKQAVGMLYLVPGTFSKSNGFEGINLETQLYWADIAG